MTAYRALIIRPGGHVPVVGGMSGLADLQEAVGGDVEAVYLVDDTAVTAVTATGRPTPALVMYVHETGLLDGLPRNQLATALARTFADPAHRIVGPVVLTAESPDGDLTDLPKRWAYGLVLAHRLAAGPSCRVCGCHDRQACPGGCGWAAPGLCTSCSP